MNTRLLVLSAICSSVATVCVVAVSFVDYLAVLMIVVAGIAIVIPLIMSSLNLKYTLLAYLSTAALSFIFCSKAYIYWVSIMLLMFIPITIIMVKCDRLHLSIEEQLPVSRKRTIVKWVLYYVVAQIAIAVTVLLTYLLVPAFFEEASGTILIYIVVALLELLVVMYDKAMHVVIYRLRPIMIRAKLL